MRLAVAWRLPGALLLTAACSGARGPEAARHDDAAAVLADPRVDPLAQAACLVGDSALRRIPGTVLRWSAAVPFDSLWHAGGSRWACRLAVIGRVPPQFEPVDSLLRWLKLRGWVDRTVLSADGPDGTIQGVHRGGVTCLIEGRWDGGDDSDSTYVPSDIMEVHFGCTRTTAGDTLPPS